MLRAAPGVTARGAKRRIFPQEDCQTDLHEGSHRAGYCSYPGVVSCSETEKRRSGSSVGKKFFTQQLSGFWVERGRLGKVVSLVGDCRPPPPGNPRRPIMEGRNRALHGRCKNALFINNRLLHFLPGGQESGVIGSSAYKLFTLKYDKNLTNLKILKIWQYFKNNRSYFYCTGIRVVLEFGISHCHLCGVWPVGSLPIAITSVLKT